MRWLSSKGRSSLGVNVGRPIVTNGDGDAIFPNYFGEDLFELEIRFVERGICPIVKSTIESYSE